MSKDKNNSKLQAGLESASGYYQEETIEANSAKGLYAKATPRYGAGGMYPRNSIKPQPTKGKGKS
jgi:hypothetical protein